MFIFTPVQAATVDILCYHEVDNPYIKTVTGAQQENIWNISSKNLRAHFEFLKANGYTVISPTDYLNGNYTGDKNILISFDDGYESFYTTVYPLLKEFGYHAVLALHNEWFTYKPADVGKLVTMDQLKEMNDSGLVELASHTYSSHKNKPTNPQGSVASIVENRLFINNRYETDEEYTARINNDFSSAQKFFSKNFNKKARIMVWPYGRFSGKATDIALKNDFKVSFLLDGGNNDASTDNKVYSKRYIVYSDLSVDGLKKLLVSANEYWRAAPIKMAQTDLDQIYSEDPKELDGNIDVLITKLKADKYNMVAIQAFCDQNGDGLIQSVYFNTKHAPIKADIFAHVANRLSQSGIRVVAWMPTLSAAWLSENPQERIQARPEQNLGWYRRATPFSPTVEQNLLALYEDLGKYSNIDGVLIQDDLYMNDFEDFSDYAKAAFVNKYGYEFNENNFKTETVQKDLLKLKIEKMDSLTDKLIAQVRKNHPNAVLMRNIYAEAVLNVQAKDWYAQDYQEYLKNYDYIVIMAYPYMENQEKNPIAWLNNLAKVSGSTDKDIADKLIFKLQKYDWKTQKWIPTKEITKQINALKQNGAKHIAVYPENIRN